MLNEKLIKRQINRLTKSQFINFILNNSNDFIKSELLKMNKRELYEIRRNITMKKIER